MAKNHRGTGIRTLPAHGRGTCPLCKSTGIKVVYEKEGSFRLVADNG